MGAKMGGPGALSATLFPIEHCARSSARQIWNTVGTRLTFVIRKMLVIIDPDCCKGMGKRPG